MKQKIGLKLRNVCGNHAIVPEGIDTLNFNKLVSVNGTAKYLWESLQGKDFHIEDMVKLLTDRYEVTEETAFADAKRLAESWKQVGLVDE